MSKAKTHPIAIRPEGQFYAGGDPAEAEGEADIVPAGPKRDKGGKERALAYIDVFDNHENVKGDWWKCAHCEKKIKKARPGCLYDEMKSHILCMHDTDFASKSDDRTIAEVCFPVSVITHREKQVADRLKRANVPRPKVLELEAEQTPKILETHPPALTVSEAIDALVAAGFTATKKEITFLTAEAKKRIREAALAKDVVGLVEGTDGAGSPQDAALTQEQHQPEPRRRRNGQQPHFGSPTG